MKIRVLGARDVDGAVSMAEAVDVVSGAFIQLSQKKAQAPVRTALKLDGEGDALVMPAFLSGTAALGAKMVTVVPGNPAKSLPAVQALVMVFDGVNGSPLAVLEGTHLTRFRTGAASGAATRALSRPESEVLAVFGAGGQSFFQVKGVMAVRKVRTIRVFDLLPDRANALIARLKEEAWSSGADVRRAGSSAEAVEGADIVVTATTSPRPVFEGRLLREGAHVNAIGAYRPEMQEVDEETILRSKVFVDSVAACLEEAGDLIIPLKNGRIQQDHIKGEIGEVLAGIRPGRTDSREITYFKSVGNAVQDVSVARAILMRAAEKGMGKEIDLG
ncbi:MAG TPA: ornithine cyclodeaminase [Thermodesulfobacteriota bacterium]|nr:ornithine cyclodeaminase [Thermodesulfobacteriota bacterium]